NVHVCLLMSVALLVVCMVCCIVVAPVILLMPRRPLSSTLFPYTTLFRSLLHASLRCPWPSSSCSPSASGGSGRSRSATASGSSRDRKSTRLNSSHQIISYAVFCLKKKNSESECHIDVNNR